MEMVSKWGNTVQYAVFISSVYSKYNTVYTYSLGHRLLASYWQAESQSQNTNWRSALTPTFEVVCHCWTLQLGLRHKGVAKMCRSFWQKFRIKHVGLLLGGSQHMMDDNLKITCLKNGVHVKRKHLAAILDSYGPTTAAPKGSFLCLTLQGEEGWDWMGLMIWHPIHWPSPACPSWTVCDLRRMRCNTKQTGSPVMGKKEKMYSSVLDFKSAIRRSGKICFGF